MLPHEHDRNPFGEFAQCATGGVDVVPGFGVRQDSLQGQQKLDKYKVCSRHLETYVTDSLRHVDYSDVQTTITDQANCRLRDQLLNVT